MTEQDEDFNSEQGGEEEQGFASDPEDWDDPQFSLFVQKQSNVQYRQIKIPKSCNFDRNGLQNKAPDWIFGRDDEDAGRGGGRPGGADVFDVENDTSLFNRVDGGGDDSQKNNDMSEEDNARTEYDAKTGRYAYSFPVPAVYYRFLVGAGRKTLQSMQSETGTEIRIPHDMDIKSEADEVIVIKARDKAGILSAKGLIEWNMEKNESKIPVTHFINIPITAQPSYSLGEVSTDALAVARSGAQSKGLVKSCGKEAGDVLDHHLDLADRFETKFLDSKHSMQFNEHYFQKAEKLHFTLLALKLHRQEEIDKVRAVLEGVGGVFGGSLLSCPGLPFPLVPVRLALGPCSPRSSSGVFVGVAFAVKISESPFFVNPGSILVPRLLLYRRGLSLNRNRRATAGGPAASVSVLYGGRSPQTLLYRRIVPMKSSRGERLPLF